MKKIIALFLALTMIFALCACGTKTETPAAPAAEESAAPAAEESAAPAADLSLRRLKARPQRS